MAHKKDKRKQKSRQTGVSSGAHSQSHRQEIPFEALMNLVERTQVGPLNAQEALQLKAALETLAFLTQEIERKRTSIERLRQMLFGPRTEKSRLLFGDERSEPGTESEDVRSGEDGEGAGVLEAGPCSERTTCETAASQEDAPPQGSSPCVGADGNGPAPGKKRKGHGRLPASAYVGAQQIEVGCEHVKPGERCPECETGRLYPIREPIKLVRVTGMAPLSAVVYNLERLRCNLCGEVFRAKVPPEVGEEKYDESVAAMVALLKYGCGLPFHRIERLQQNLGIPLPCGTQWLLVESGADELAAVYDEMAHQAAQGEVLHNDDTTMRLLELSTQRKNVVEGSEEDDGRTGVFTTGIVSVEGGRQIALFITGGEHAGENLSELLKKREQARNAPIQMCDALSRNVKGLGASGEFETIVANCLVHGRRLFVEQVNNFPEETKTVLTLLREVYGHDAKTKEEGMDPEGRLLYHQKHSQPLMDELAEWMQKQFDERRVEQNSGLGKAIGYLQSHWTALTQFLRVPGAPLDNNICERALKKAILHRKNALFYKTFNGARVGDLFMSLIHTAELNGANPFDYLHSVLRHADLAGANPAAWMPWNYTAALPTASPLSAQSPL